MCVIVFALVTRLLYWNIYFLAHYYSNEILIEKYENWETEKKTKKIISQNDSLLRKTITQFVRNSKTNWLVFCLMFAFTRLVNCISLNNWNENQTNEPKVEISLFQSKDRFELWLHFIVSLQMIAYKQREQKIKLLKNYH